MGCSASHPDPVLLDVLGRVQETSITFVDQLDSFLKNKRGILDVYVTAVGTPSALETLVIPIVDDFKVPIADGPQLALGFNAKYLQQTTGARAAVTTMDELYGPANAVRPEFVIMVNEIGAAVGGSVTVEVVPLKDRARAQKKADDDYTDRVCVNGQGDRVSAAPGTALGWLFDVVRMRFMCNTAEEIRQVLAKVLADPRVKAVLNGKNRFAVKTANGFCDLLLHVLISVEANGERVLIEHVCEIQIHLRPVTHYAVAHGSHESYDYFRTYFNGSMDLVSKKLQSLERMIGHDYERVAGGEYTGDTVLEQLILDVKASQDTLRMKTFQRFVTETVEEHELAVHIGKMELAVYEAGTEPTRSTLMAATYIRMARSLGELERGGSSNEAFAMATKALGLQLDELDPNHPAIARTYQTLAGLLKNQGKLDDARTYEEKSLAIVRKRATAEPDNRKAQLDVAIGYNNIAVLHAMQDQKIIALRLFKKVLKLREDILPEADHGEITTNHRPIATAYNNIAGVLATQGPAEQAEAMDLFKKALVIKLKVHGPHSTSVASTYEGIGSLLWEQKKLEEAKAMLEKAIAIEVKVNGKAHPTVTDIQAKLSKIDKALEKPS